MSWGNCVVNGVATLNCIFPLFQNIISVLLSFAGIVALFFIIISGFRYMTSGGDPKQLEGARKTLTYAILGLAVVLGSFFVINLIAEATGVSCIRIFGFNNCK